MTYLVIFLQLFALADTPPARAINALLYDAYGNPITSTPSSGTNALNVFNVNQASTSDVSPANQAITALDVGTSSLVGANGQVFYFGTPTTNSATNFALSSINNVTVEATLIGGGTMQIEVSYDAGALWTRPNVYQISTQNYTNGFTSNFIAIVNVAGATNVRVRSTGSWSGSATIMLKESLRTRSVTVSDSLPPGTNSIGSIGNILGTVSLPSGAAKEVNQITFTGNQTNGAQKTQVVDGSGNVQPAGDAVSRALNFKFTDGTNTTAVKPASTAAVASDPSAVVALSPNSPLPAGTNSVGVVSTKTALTANAPASVNVPITSTATVAANAARKGLVITNASSNMEACAVGTTAVLNSGIVLYPGGVWNMNEFSFTTGAINCVGSAAGTTTSVQEFQ